MNSPCLLNLRIKQRLKYLPLDNNPSKIGNEITDMTYNEIGHVEKLNIPGYPKIDFINKLNNNLSYFKKKLKSNENIHFDKNCKFFFRDIYNPPYILVINQLGK